MSVRTTSDELLEEAKMHIDNAYKSVYKALDPDTWGSGDYSIEHTERIWEVLKILSDLKHKL